MYKIRPAKKNESTTLTDIAIRSEGYWGYSEDLMEKFKSSYSITDEFLQNNPSYVLEDNHNIIGFYSLIVSSPESQLEYFYIEPDCIGKGYGKKLWSHTVETCRAMKLDSICFVTSPQAKDFYIKMGALTTGKIESSVYRGRMIPQFKFHL